MNQLGMKADRGHIAVEGWLIGTFGQSHPGQYHKKGQTKDLSYAIQLAAKRQVYIST